MVGQVIVDENLNIICTNNQMLENFDIEPYDITGLSFRHTFLCMELGCNCCEYGKSMF